MFTTCTAMQGDPKSLPSSPPTALRWEQLFLLANEKTKTQRGQGHVSDHPARYRLRLEQPGGSGLNLKGSSHSFSEMWSLRDSWRDLSPRTLLTLFRPGQVT